MALAGALLAMAAASAADPIAATASRADIERWFAAARQQQLDWATPKRWAYSFSASDGRSLEALSLVLVRDGYRIVRLAGGPKSALLMDKVEPHSPRTLVQRNQWLRDKARRSAHAMRPATRFRATDAIARVPEAHPD